MCDKCKPTDEIPYCSMQARLDRAGVETIESECKKPDKTKIRFNGKTIYRGYAINCVDACRKGFGIEI